MPKCSARRKRYLEYLQSEHWASLRESALKRDNYACVKCQKTEQLQVHHEIYREKLEDGILEDIITLCKKHHRIAHGLWVESEREFDLRLKAINDNLIRHNSFPSLEDQILLSKSTEDELDEWEAEAMYREIAGLRMILNCKERGRMWNSWLTKSMDVHLRLWPWSERKRRTLRTLETSPTDPIN